MKFRNLFVAVMFNALLILPNQGFGQILNLGTIENFIFYTGAGAITNAHTSSITGDVGTNFGELTGFGPPSTYTGTQFNEDATTAQARLDLLSVYIHLNDLPITNNTHAAAFGSETITPGVYSIVGAGSVGGILTLDGQGNSNALFIIKFEGAMTVGAASTVVLTNETRSCNVFWIAEGAISMGANVTMKGNLIAHNGAISMGTVGDFEGRMLSMAGAITFGPGVASKPSCYSTIPIVCENSCTNTTLGSAASYVFFTAGGADANTGISGVIGDMGTEVGAISGFEASVVVGSPHIADAHTTQAGNDLQAAYTQLYGTPNTNTSHAPVFGGGETLVPGVYAIAAAGSLGGAITLDGVGNRNSIFIIKFGAAFTVGANSRINLTNGARFCNVFWLAEGAISIGAFSVLKGNFISNNAAVDIGANCFLQGRLLSTGIGGAIGVNTSTAYISYSLCGNTLLPVELSSFTSVCVNNRALIKWSTISENNNSPFTLERSTDGDQWEIATTVAGEGSSTVPHDYSFTDEITSKSANCYYRLRQTDDDNQYKYSKTIAFNNCGLVNDENLTVYPNPSIGSFNLSLSRDQNQVSSTTVFNLMGENIYQANGFHPTIDLSNQVAGGYLIRILTDSEIITSKIIFKN